MYNVYTQGGPLIIRKNFILEIKKLLGSYKASYKQLNKKCKLIDKRYFFFYIFQTTLLFIQQIYCCFLK